MTKQWRWLCAHTHTHTHTHTLKELEMRWRNAMGPTIYSLCVHKRQRSICHTQKMDDILYRLCLSLSLSPSHSVPGDPCEVHFHSWLWRPHWQRTKERACKSATHRTALCYMKGKVFGIRKGANYPGLCSFPLLLLFLSSSSSSFSTTYYFPS